VRARCRLDAGDAAGAVALFEREITIAVQRKLGDERVGSMRTDLAKALWAGGRRDDARRAAEEAGAALRATPDSLYAKQLADWLATHG